MVGGAIDGAIRGFTMPASVFKPVTGAICMVSGATTEGLTGIAMPLVAAVRNTVEVPCAVMRPGSLARKWFRAMDLYRAARLHVGRKKMSTQEIADHTSKKIEEAQGRLRKKTLLPYNVPAAATLVMACIEMGGSKTR